MLEGWVQIYPRHTTSWQHLKHNTVHLAKPRHILSCPNIVRTAGEFN